jgi:TolB-like protein/Tfp pilus assembly protein PilF
MSRFRLSSAGHPSAFPGWARVAMRYSPSMLKYWIVRPGMAIQDEAMLYRFRGFTLDTGRFELACENQVVQAEPQVVKLITYLIENRERTVSRSELLDHLWDARVVTDNALSVCVRMARNILGDDGHHQLFIRTVPRVGYRFVADADATAIVQAPIADFHDADDRDQPVDLEHEDARLISRPSVVVIPFVSIGDPPMSSVFSEGLTHDITTRIARSRSLFVIARGTAFKYGGGYPDVRAIGRKLGVRYVVHGAVQQFSQKMRITAILADSVTQEEIWSESYERRIDDFSTVQEEIAEIIVASLQTEVDRAERLRSLLIPSTNLDAWSAYHRGCWHMYRFRPEDLNQAERFFRRSIDLEPTVPRPYAGLSFICFERVFLHMDDDPASGIASAFEYAQQALAIDPNDPMAHWAESRAHLLQGNLESSKQSLKTAIRLNPSFAVAQYSLGWVGLQLGDYELCKSRIDMARRLSPFDPLMFAMLGVYALNLALMGDTDEAAELARQSVIQPNVHYQSLAYAAVILAIAGQLREGARYMSRARAVVPQYSSKHFFDVFRFKRAADIKTIKRAFADIEAYSRSA